MILQSTNLNRSGDAIYYPYLHLPAAPPVGLLSYGCWWASCIVEIITLKGAKHAKLEYHLGSFRTARSLQNEVRLWGEILTRYWFPRARSVSSRQLTSNDSCPNIFRRRMPKPEWMVERDANCAAETTESPPLTEEELWHRTEHRKETCNLSRSQA